jgi:hypothetical protein
MKYDWVDEVVPKELSGVVLNHEECFVALCCEKPQREHEVLQLVAALPPDSKEEAPHHFQNRVVHWLVLEVEQGSHVYVL